VRLQHRTIAVGVVVAVTVALLVASFATEQALAAPFILCQPPFQPVIDPLTYVSGIVALSLLYWAASGLARRHPARRGFARWLVGISIAATLFFGLLALLGLGFWSSAREVTAAETVLAGVLFVIALAGPAIASLVASILLLADATRPMPPVIVPPLAFVGVTAISVGVLWLSSATAC